MTYEITRGQSNLMKAASHMSNVPVLYDRLFLLFSFCVCIVYYVLCISTNALANKD